MNRKFLSVALTLVLILSFSFPVLASVDDSDARLDYITDSAGLLTSSQGQELYSEAAAVSQKQACSVYVILVEDYTDYVDSSITDCAQTLYDYYNLGWGEDRDGILLLLSMDDRDYGLIAHGDTANSAFTDYGKYVLADEFLDDFAENDWYEGLEDYIEGCDEFLDLYYSGSPVDTGPDEYDGRYDDAYEDYFGTSGSIFDSIAVKLGITILIPLIIAAVVCAVLRSKMKSVHIAKDANRYADRNSLRLTDRSDRFTHTTEMIMPKPDTNKSSGGFGGLGGGGTSISGGFSGHGGKF